MAKPEDTTTEYRIAWSASTNITFSGATDWEPWDEDGDPEDVLYENESSGLTNMPPGLSVALEASGFDWWVETREAAR